MLDHYNQLFHEATQKIAEGEYHIDRLIDDPSDKRYGLSLIVKPSGKIISKIQAFQDCLKSVAPQQYYYPSSDMHLTVLSVISAYNGFNCSQVEVNAYVELIKKCLDKHRPFQIAFKGVTASPSGLMIQGFNEGEELNRIRNDLRAGFRASSLKQSIDKRYAIQTAHSTVVRFRTELINRQAFLRVLAQNREKDFGKLRVEQLLLVANDWYHRRERVQELAEFALP